ncbi:MAG: hypothetical protein ACRDMY_08865 [Gaiellaceae bacterium]
MLHPETQLDLVRQRHNDLEREARAGHLAKRLAAARREERVSFLSRLRRKPHPCPPAAQPTSS